MKIGYVGLGAMGGALAQWLIDDHALLVWDMNPAAIDRLVAKGCHAATSLPQLARDSDVILLCLPRSADVEQALFGPGGLAEGLSAGKLIIDQTSGIPADTAGFAERLQAMGVSMLDAPVAGGVPSAVARNITIMVSGPAEAQQRALPAFQAMTTKIFPAGDRVGNAQAVKTLNNMLNMVYRVATLELAALAVASGVALPRLIEVLNGGIGGNFSSRAMLPAVAEGRSTGSFALTLMLKDNNQAIALATEAGVPMPLSCLARAVLQQNINIIGPQAGLDEVITFMAQATGVDYLQPAQPDSAGDETAAVIAAALAASNRVAVYEIMALAVRLGLNVADFGQIVNNGSAWSRECENILAELKGASADRSLGDAVAALQKVENLAKAKGIPLVISGMVRAIYEAALNELGGDAGLEAMAAFSTRASGVSLGA